MSTLNGSITNKNPKSVINNTNTSNSPFYQLQNNNNNNNPNNDSANNSSDSASKHSNSFLPSESVNSLNQQQQQQQQQHPSPSTLVIKNGRNSSNLQQQPQVIANIVEAVEDNTGANNNGFQLVTASGTFVYDFNPENIVVEQASKLGIYLQSKALEDKVRIYKIYNIDMKIVGVKT